MHSEITVRTQAELDAALATHGADEDATIIVSSPRDVWLELGAYGSATVYAYDSATVYAYGSALVTATGSATVRAYDSATVYATPYVAVHLHSARATVTGGALIDVAGLDLTDPHAWVTYTGAEVIDGTVILYKAVDGDLYAGHSYKPTRYPIGKAVTATDWRDTNECGNGLHASPHPHEALAYYTGAARMLRVSVPLDDLRPIPGGTPKAKAQTLNVIDEVTLTGDPLPTSRDAA